MLQRIRIEDIRYDEWFRKSYVPVRLVEYEDVNLDDVYAVFDDPEVGKALNMLITILIGSVTVNIRGVLQ